MQHVFILVTEQLVKGHCKPGWLRVGLVACAANAKFINYVLSQVKMHDLTLWSFSMFVAREVQADEKSRPHKAIGNGPHTTHL